MAASLAIVFGVFFSGATVANADPVCYALGGRCYGVRGMPNQGTQQMEEVYANQAWICQSIPASHSQNFALNTLWAYTPNNSFVEFGITTGKFIQNGVPIIASREWYAARYSADGSWYGENLVSSPKPNRNTAYITSIRYDGSNWNLFHGSNLKMIYQAPDSGRISAVATGAETTHSQSSASGRSNAFKHRRAGESLIRNGWPGTLVNRLDANFTGTWTASTGEWRFWNQTSTVCG